MMEKEFGAKTTGNKKTAAKITLGKAVCVLLISVLAVPAIVADITPGYTTPKNILVITTSPADTRTVLYELSNDEFSVCRSGVSPNGAGYHDGPFNNVFTWIPTVYDQAIPSLATACGGNPCDQVWDYRFAAADGDPCVATTNRNVLGPGQAATLRAFMASSAASIPPGRTVFIVGDNGGFNSCRNNGVISFVNSVVAAGTFAATGSGYANVDGTNAVISLPEAVGAENFNIDARCLTCCATNGQVWTQYAGGIRLSELAGGRPVYQAPLVAFAGVTETAAVGIAWMYNDLKAPYNFSKLFLWMDWQSFKNTPTSRCCVAAMDTGDDNQANSSIVSNIFDFLVIIPSPTPTITATVTPTITPIMTSTNTPSITMTATNSFTRTGTPTATQTSTSTTTSTVTPTNSLTNTPTVSFTATPSVSFTSTPTVTFTSTKTNTATMTDTATPTVSFTNTQTITATLTRTSTKTMTETATPSVSFTNTATITPTSTKTDTKTMTQTATPSSTKTDTPTPADTNTATETVTPTSTKTYTATASPTSTDSPVYTLTVTLTATETATQTFTKTSTPTSTDTPTVTETFTPTFTRTITLTMTQTSTPTYTPSVTATITETAAFTWTITPTITETITLTRTKTITQTITETYTPTITRTITGTITPTRTPTDTPTVTMTSSDTPQLTFTVTPSATHTITMTLTPTASFTVTLTPTPQPADILLTMEGVDTTGTAGGTVELRVTLRNNGGGWARGVMLTDLLPGEVDFEVIGSDADWSADVFGNITLNAGDIAAGAYREIKLFVRIKDSVTADTVTIPPMQADFTDDADPLLNITKMSLAVVIKLGEIQIFPNPFNPTKAKDGKMKFLNLPRATNVFIYTLSGELVIMWQAMNTSSVLWDGKNMFKKETASGIYYYVIQNEDKKISKTGKIFIYR